MKRIVMLAGYAAVALVLYLYGNDVLQWLRTDSDPFTASLIATVMSLFPVIPYPVVGGIIGAAYGPAVGGVVTWVGSTAASLLMFLFVRYAFRPFADRFLHARKGLGKVTVLFERNAFLAILFSRMIPVIPSIIINVYAALSRVSFGVYALASALGKVPAMLLFALLGNSIVTAPQTIVLTLGVYGVFMAVTLYLYRRWQRKPHVAAPE